VELSIHFSASLPRPVVLCGEVVQSAPGEERQLAVAFRDIGSAVNDHLERLVFRRHRRSIAQQRPLETA
ncbi:MAG TPA: PilZ domain-containing protein, partial [Alphaproteobacteria bacterium]|nr:PilZ domain-containing protein [Alphaproteobacteria bacterium]